MEKKKREKLGNGSARHPNRSKIPIPVHPLRPSPRRAPLRVALRQGRRGVSLAFDTGHGLPSRAAPRLRRERLAKGSDVLARRPRHIVELRGRLRLGLGQLQPTSHDLVHPRRRHRHVPEDGPLPDLASLAQHHLEDLSGGVGL